MKLADLPTYVYIDASNIRNACKNSLHFDLDFLKLFQYLSAKYSKLRAINYFEGIADDDKKKQAEFDEFKKAGTTILTLARKAYQNPAKFRKITCEECQHVQKIQIAKKTQSLKSNIDVYLCANLIKQVLSSNTPTHFILLSCDGDFADMINTAFEINPRIYVSVIATPQTAKNNYLSIRLKKLREIPNYNLINIASISDKVAKRKEPHRGGTLDRCKHYSKSKRARQALNQEEGKK
jgi:hypothetical protein